MRNTNQRAEALLDFKALDPPGLAADLNSTATAVTGNANLSAQDVAKMPFTAAQMTAGASAITTAHTTRENAPTPLNTKALQAACNDGIEIMIDTAHWGEGWANTKAPNYEAAVALLLSLGLQARKPAGPKADLGFVLSSPVKGELDIHVPTSARGTTRLVRYSTDGGKTYGTALVVHGKILTVFGFPSAATIFVQQTVSAAPAKRARARVPAGGDGLTWSDPASFVIS